MSRGPLIAWEDRGRPDQRGVGSRRSRQTTPPGSGSSSSGGPGRSATETWTASSPTTARTWCSTTSPSPSASGAWRPTAGRGRRSSSPGSATPASSNSTSWEVTAGAEAAFCHCVVRCAGSGPGADPAEQLDVRLTMGLARRAGQWTVVHEHHSVAAD
ncbi:nuclear transport factor 2 family protein [Saccharopolyspora erythraea]|nr:nuclear transport factor 2 family protein [Saccharopolyspora erythraea]